MSKLDKLKNLESITSTKNHELLGIITQEKNRLNDLLQKRIKNYFKKILSIKDPKIDLFFKGNFLYIFEKDQSYLDSSFNIEFIKSEKLQSNFKLYNDLRLNSKLKTITTPKDFQKLIFLGKISNLIYKNKNNILINANNIPHKIYSKSKLPSLYTKLNSLRRNYHLQWYKDVTSKILEILEKDILIIKSNDITFPSLFSSSTNPDNVINSIKVINQDKSNTNLEIKGLNKTTNKPIIYNYSLPTSDLKIFIYEFITPRSGLSSWFYLFKD